MTSVEGQRPSAGSWLLATCAHQGYKAAHIPTLRLHTRWKTLVNRALGRLSTPGATGSTLHLDRLRKATYTDTTHGKRGPSLRLLGTSVQERLSHQHE